VIWLRVTLVHGKQCDSGSFLPFFVIRLLLRRSYACPSTRTSAAWSPSSSNNVLRAFALLSTW